MKKICIAIFLLITSTTVAKSLSCRQLFVLATGEFTLPLEKIPMFKLMYLSGKKLASIPGIEIAGFLKNAGTFKEVAEKLAQRVKNFDRNMERMGFIVPESSRIVLFNKAPFSLFPRGRMVYAMEYPVFNLWKRRQQRLIVIDSPNPHYLYEMLYSADIVLHERAHNFLLYTYGKSGLVARNKIIHEALADFFAAHALDDPQIGRYLNDIIPLRDIAKKMSSTKKSRFEVLSGPVDIQKDNYHANSVFFSNILWEVRKLLGAEETSKMLRPFVDNLHLYRKSFEHWYPEFAGGKRFETLNIKGDLLYFLAVLDKTANKVEVNHVITKIAREWEFNLGEIKNVSRYMKKTGEITGLDLEEEQKLGVDLVKRATKTLVFKKGVPILVVLGSLKFGTWVYDKLTSQDTEQSSE